MPSYTYETAYNMNDLVPEIFINDNSENNQTYDLL